jgi:ABC-type dipeptide/oligopeptide/nickel transport system permease component
MLFCFSYVILILAADMLAVLFNPRLRRGIRPAGPGR